MRHNSGVQIFSYLIDVKVVRLRVCESRFKSEMSKKKERKEGWSGGRMERDFQGPKMVRIALA